MVTDYMGNEIKEGDEIVFITVLNVQHFRRIGWYMGDVKIGDEEPKRDPIPCFEKGKYHKVEIHEDHLCYTVKDGQYTITLPIYDPFRKEEQIIGIKGKSDLENQYIDFKNKTNDKKIFF